MKNIEKLVRNAGLKVTAVRIKSLQALKKSKQALSHAELGSMFPEVDRVTLYRTLSTFEEKGIIHRIIDKSGTIKYSSCSSSCDHNELHDQHLHFTCNSCNSTVCLDEIDISPPKLPAKYELKQYFTLATGTCPQCA